MAFNVSYSHTCERDIKYTLSDRRIQFPRARPEQWLPLREERPLPPLKRYPQRFYDYYPRLGIGIPRAPAFRGTDPEHIEKIVARICKPIQCQKTRRADLSEDLDLERSHDKDGESSTSGKSGSETQRSDGSRMSSKDIASLIARLQKPTESSRKKSYFQRRQEDEKEADRRFKMSPLPDRRLPPLSTGVGG